MKREPITKQNIGEINRNPTYVTPSDPLELVVDNTRKKSKAGLFWAKYFL